MSKNWEETMLRDDEIEKLDYSYDSPFLLSSRLVDRHVKHVVAKAQAEKAYKAGVEEGRKVCPTNEIQGTIYLEGKQAGLKSVVEWIKTDNIELWEERTEVLYGWKVHKLDLDIKSKDYQHNERRQK